MDRISPAQTRRLDELLRTGLGEYSGLPPDFEQAVMQKISARPRNWLAAHSVFLVMCVYWLGAVSFSAWLVLDSSIGFEALSVSTVLVAVLIPMACFMPLWLLLRRFRVHVGDLILRTLQ
jgi:hypothetical protein